MIFSFNIKYVKRIIFKIIDEIQGLYTITLKSVEGFTPYFFQRDVNFLSQMNKTRPSKVLFEKNGIVWLK